MKANNTKPYLPWLHVSPSRPNGVAVTYSEHTRVRTVPPKLWPLCLNCFAGHSPCCDFPQLELHFGPEGGSVLGRQLTPTTLLNITLMKTHLWSHSCSSPLHGLHTRDSRLLHPSKSRAEAAMLLVLIGHSKSCTMAHWNGQGVWRWSAD